MEVFTVIIIFSLIVGPPLGIFVMSLQSPPPKPREKTADEYDCDTLLLAAKKRHLDITTELKKSEIEAARIEALHKERDEIIKHDKQVRRLNQILDERRSA